MSIANRLNELELYAGGYDSEKLRNAFVSGIHHTVEVITDEISLNDNAKPVFNQQTRQIDYYTPPKETVKHEPEKYVFKDEKADEPEIQKYTPEIKSIQPEKKSSEWIKISDRIPPYGKWLIVLLKYKNGGYYATSGYLSEDNFTLWNKNKMAPDPFKNAEYWMEIPEFPDGVKVIDML